MNMAEVESLFRVVGWGRRLEPDNTVATIKVDPVLIDSLRDAGLWLISRVHELEEQNEMACIEPDPECGCSGCAYAAERMGA